MAHGVNGKIFKASRPCAGDFKMAGSDRELRGDQSEVRNITMKGDMEGQQNPNEPGKSNPGQGGQQQDREKQERERQQREREKQGGGQQGGGGQHGGGGQQGGQQSGR
jgi:hypothetical protein